MYQSIPLSKARLNGVPLYLKFVIKSLTGPGTIEYRQRAPPCWVRERRHRGYRPRDQPLTQPRGRPLQHGQPVRSQGRGKGFFNHSLALDYGT